MTNYIEVEHEYTDTEGDTNWDVYHAVKPSPDRYTFKSGGSSVERSSFNNPWYINGGQSVTVYSQEDISGLRKLLDVIESEFQADERKS